MKRRGRLPVKVGAVALVLAAGCQTAREAAAPGDVRPRFHNWWNYYELAADFLEKGQTELARVNFERSLGLRPGAKFGYAKEMWRARTYGLHFIEGYFPHRELGVCLYRQDKSPEAIRFLEKSMSMEPSGRAKHYLNLARQRVLDARSAGGPEVTLSPATEAVWTKERRREVAGVARAGARVAELVIDGRPWFIELAEERIAFRREVSVRAGTNRVTVCARDLLGRAATQRVVWIADWSPPSLAIGKITRDADAWSVEARCTDDQGLASVTVNGEDCGGGGPATAAPRGKDVPVVVRLPKGRDAVFLARGTWRATNSRPCCCTRTWARRRSQCRGWNLRWPRRARRFPRRNRPGRARTR